MAGSGNPELQRLLATLNSYAPRVQQQPTGHHETQQLQQQQQQQQAAEYSSSHGNFSLAGHKRPYELTTASSSSVQWMTPSPASTVNNTALAIPGLGMLSTQTITPAQAPGLALAPAATPTPTPTPTAVPQSLAATKPPTPTPTASATKPPPTIPDPSRITTYPAALKHVTKHLATSETASARIRHLISTQHQHERQWHAGREALLALQASRPSTSAQVSALLRSLGGKDTTATATSTSTTTTSTSTSTAGSITTSTNSNSSSINDTNKAELAAYDAKVHRGLVAMQADFARQLRNLGVPLFAISHDLVLQDGESMDTTTTATGGGQKKLDKGELRELQKRMLALLEDLFGD